VNKMEEQIINNTIIVLHNIFSSQKIIETAKIVYGLGFKNFVITKAQGSAAQMGVPEAQKLAMQKSANLIYLQDLDDAIEILKPSKIFLFVPEGYAKIEYDPQRIRNALNADRVMLVFGGAEPGLTRRELEKGETIYIKGLKDQTTTGTIAIALYLLLFK